MAKRQQTVLAILELSDVAKALVDRAIEDVTAIREQLLYDQATWAYATLPEDVERHLTDAQEQLRKWLYGEIRTTPTWDMREVTARSFLLLCHNPGAFADTFADVIPANWSLMAKLVGLCGFLSGLCDDGEQSAVDDASAPLGFRVLRRGHPGMRPGDLNRRLEKGIDELRTRQILAASV